MTALGGIVSFIWAVAVGIFNSLLVIIDKNAVLALIVCAIGLLAIIFMFKIIAGSGWSFAIAITLLAVAVIVFVLAYVLWIHFGMGESLMNTLFAWLGGGGELS